MKKFKIFITSFLAIILIFTLSACSNKKEKANLPSAKTVLTGAQNTNLNSLNATWKQADANGNTTQKASAKYNKKPLIMYADISTNANHCKMWLNDKTNYIQMSGTATNKWFKTKASNNSNYSQLADSIAKNALLNFNDSAAKLFKVKKTAAGYTLTYHGNSKEIWQTIQQSSSITSMIGIDFSNAKPTKINITINTDKNYKLTSLNVSAKYQETKKSKSLLMKVDQINKLGKLQIPTNVTKKAVNLEKIK